MTIIITDNTVRDNTVYDNTIHIIGIGVAEVAELDVPARDVLGKIDIVIGTERQLATVDKLLSPAQHRILLPKLSELKSLVEYYSKQSLAVLASGDPLYYGIGRWFSKHFANERLQFYPAVSSLQVACHRLGIALQELVVLSLHGRPLASIRQHLRRQARLLILTDHYSQPQHLAQECMEAGFTESVLIVCENLGYHNEKITRASVEALIQQWQSFDPLHVTYIEVLGLGGIQPEFPGIPDEHFITGQEAGRGMISKREVRLNILSFMQVAKGDVVWDIGAGCGSVSVELALWQPQANVYGVEYHQQRLRCLQQNRERFGVLKNLHIIKGRAPHVLRDLPTPNKVFIGGSGGELAKLLMQVWQQLPVRGVLVASAVTENTKQQLRLFAQKNLAPNHFECVSLGVKRGQLVAGEINDNAKLPVEIYQFIKPLVDDK